MNARSNIVRGNKFNFLILLWNIVWGTVFTFQGRWGFVTVFAILTVAGLVAVWLRIKHNKLHYPNEW